MALDHRMWPATGLEMTRASSWKIWIFNASDLETGPVDDLWGDLCAMAGRDENRLAWKLLRDRQ